MSASLPNALPAFISIAQAALPASFQVVFDTIYNPYIAPQTLLITGVHFLEDTYAELGPRYQHEEHYSIRCTLSSSSGAPGSTTPGGAQVDLMVQTYALYSDISIAVAQKATLNGTVRLAWCAQLDYAPTHDARGLLLGALNFEVEVQTRVDSAD